MMKAAVKSTLTCAALKPMRTGVVHPCSVAAIAGALEAQEAGLIEPVLFGPQAEIFKLAEGAKLDLSKCTIVSTADSEESAAKAAAEAARLEPTNLRYLYEAARQAQFMKQYEESISFLNGIMSRHPNYKRTGFLLGFAHQMSERNAEAVKVYEDYLKIQPDDHQAHFNLAFACMKMGEYLPAIAHYEKTLELKPGYNECHLRLADCFRQLGRTEEAERHQKLWDAR